MPARRGLEAACARANQEVLLNSTMRNLPCQRVQVHEAHKNSKGHQKSWVLALPLERLIRTLPHDRRHAFAIIPATDPQVSPLRAPAVDGLAPAIIHTAEFDPVRDEGAAYTARVERAGVPPIHRCHSGMIHLFHGLGGLIPHAAEVYRIIGDDVRAPLR
jgi:acetyl esterase/lipase